MLHLLASPFFSGPAESLAYLALAQRELGYDVSIAVDRKRTAIVAEELAVPRLAELGVLADVGLELSVKSTPLAVGRDIQRLRALRVDVLHCHFSHDHVLARWGRRAPTTLIRSIHAPRSLRGLLPTADGFTIPESAMARKLIGKRVVVLPPVIDPRFRVPNNRRGLRKSLRLPDGPLVAMISTFQASRHHEVGVEAFEQLVRRVPHAHLILTGDGELKATIVEAVERRGLTNRVHFVGYQRSESFVQYVQAVDEVWLLGLGNDFGARAAVQARSCGARVVAVDEGALARYADAVVPLDARALAEVALRNQRRVVEVSSAREVASRVEALYRGSPL